ncbi:hypothetical protein HHK36_020331 [Tetracentron sinense]|uniref:Uncharacterized protein n=1 Tax=Tetracentron sinense TaxID=13715 RepID=A0A835D8R0_TETSI|nr:hypothetical protein HHK36_020331 [Tetracentron sinense]
MKEDKAVKWMPVKLFGCRTSYVGPMSMRIVYSKPGLHYMIPLPMFRVDRPLIFSIPVRKHDGQELMVGMEEHRMRMYILLGVDFSAPGLVYLVSAAL